MSQNSNFLKTTLDKIENDPEVKSFIYQQILDFNPFVTPETLVMVIARDPSLNYSEDLSDDEDDVIYFDEYESTKTEAPSENFKYRIAVVLKEGDSSIEAEAFHDDIFEAIRLAKDKLVQKLIEIQEEIENPQDRMNAIKDASENKQVH